MSYTTDFSGEITVDPPLNEHEISFIQAFNESRRMIRTRGPLFVGGSGFRGQNSGDDDVIDGNRASGEAASQYGITTHADQELYLRFYEEGGQPGLWCQWTCSDDGEVIEWDGGEKFYNAAEWMKYLVTHLLHGEEARAYVAKHVLEDDRLAHFTFDHVLNGTIHAQGEDSEDTWKLVVEGSVVKVSSAEVTFTEPTAI